MLPFLEKLQEADLAYQLDEEAVTAFAPIPLPTGDEE